MELEKNLYVTKDYDRFKIRKDNREVKLTRAFLNSLESTNGNVQPISVDRNYYIIDGQHRHAGCKKLGLPLRVVMMDKDIDPHKAMLLMNSNQRNWTAKDFILSFAKNNVKGYKEIKDILEREELVNIDVITKLSKISQSKLKLGNPIDVPEFLEERIDAYKLILRALQGHISRKGAVADAVNIVEDRLNEEEKKGQNPRKKWDYERVANKLIEVIPETGVSAIPKLIAELLSKANDKSKANKNKLNLRI